MKDRDKMTGLLGEETVSVPAEAQTENPYWLAEEAEPHPNPELGCIRRGICCRSSPGWFAPNEIEKAAAHLELSPDGFVRRYLIIDQAMVDGVAVEVFAPVKLDREGRPALRPATRVDELYRVLRGTCIFFENEGCGIYPARPIECARYVCTNAPEDNLSHVAIGRLWQAAATAAENA